MSILSFLMSISAIGCLSISSQPPKAEAPLPPSYIPEIRFCTSCSTQTQVMAYESSIGSTQLHLAEDTAYMVVRGVDVEHGEKLECEGRSCDVLFKRKPDPNSIMRNEWIVYNFSFDDVKRKMIFNFANLKFFNRDTLALLSGELPSTDYKCDTLDKGDFIVYYEGMKHRLMTDTLLRKPDAYESPTCCRFEVDGELRHSFSSAPYLDLYKRFMALDTLPYKHFPYTESISGVKRANFLWVTIYCQWASLDKFYEVPGNKYPPDWDVDLCDVAYYIQFQLMQD